MSMAKKLGIGAAAVGALVASGVYCTIFLASASLKTGLVVVDVVFLRDAISLQEVNRCCYVAQVRGGEGKSFGRGTPSLDPT